MASAKTLVAGIVLLALAGVGGLVYRNAVERPIRSGGVCPADAKVCPDGTILGRTGPSCTFPECPTHSPDLETATTTDATSSPATATTSEER